jgi:hypothetical protein
VAEIVLFMRNTKKYNLSYMSFKIIPLCYCPLLPADVEVLETFLDAVCESLFSSFVAFLMVPVASQDAVRSVLNSVEGKRLKSAAVKSGAAPLLSHCYLLRNSRSKPAGVLKHCRKEEANSVLHSSGRFLLSASLRQRRVSMYIFSLQFYINFPHAAIALNYIQEYL